MVRIVQIEVFERWIQCLSFSILFAISTVLGADIQSTPKPWDHLRDHMLGSLVGWPSLLHLTAAGSTALLLESGADAAVHREAAAQDASANAVWFAPLLVSTFAPAAVPASLWLFGGSRESAGAASAALQSVAVGFFYNNVLKAVTGRLPPESDHPDPESQADGFQFGFLRGGLFNGWPSGHMMTNSSLAASLAAYYPDQPWVRWGALAYALAVGGAVTYGARGDIHWISDTVAGGLMGLGIGWTVGSGFRRRLDATSAVPEAERRFSWHPIVGGRLGVGAELSL